MLEGHDHFAHVFLFVLHGFARAPSINTDRHQTNRKKHQGHNGKLPIHHQENNNSAHDRDRLFENVAAHRRQRHLHAAGIIGNARHKKPGPHFVKELHRVTDDFAEELVSDVGYHSIAYPVHVVSISVGAKTARGHNPRNGETNPKNRVDLRADAQHLLMGQDGAWIGRGPVENEIRYLQHG